MTFVAYGNTYPVKEELKALGGRWNKENRRWEFADEPTKQVKGVAFAPATLPEGWHTSEYFVEVGKIFLRPLALKDKSTGTYPRNEYAVSVATWDDKTFDTDEERWVSCSVTLYRPLTDSEWKAEAAKRARAKETKETRKRFLDLIHEQGSIIEGQLQVLPEGERLTWNARSQPDYVILTADAIVVAHYNGASGDDWSYNNYRGYVVWSCPLSDEIKASYDALIATFRTEEK